MVLHGGSDSANLLLCARKELGRRIQRATLRHPGERECVQCKVCARVCERSSCVLYVRIYALLYGTECALPTTGVDTAMHADADADTNRLGAHATCRPAGTAGAKASMHCRAVKAMAHSTPVERLRTKQDGTGGTGKAAHRHITAQSQHTHAAPRGNAAAQQCAQLTSTRCSECPSAPHAKPTCESHGALWTLFPAHIRLCATADARAPGRTRPHRTSRPACQCQPVNACRLVCPGTASTHLIVLMSGLLGGSSI